MKRLLSRRALLLLLIFTLCFVSTMNAQSNDAFIFNYTTSYRELDAGGFNIGTQIFGSDVVGGFNITTQVFGQETPLDGGLLVLALAGAAYTFKNRKKNNKK